MVILMGRILALDYGKKRTGIAVTDPLRITAGPLITVDTVDLPRFLSQYMEKEAVDFIVIGDTSDDDSYHSHIGQDVQQLKERLTKQFPGIQVVLHDEQYTSAKARQIVLQSGARKMKRRDKKLTDKIAASLILHDFLETRQLWNK